MLCAAPVHAQSVPSPRPMPDSVRSYIAVAIATFREHSVHRATTDWDALEQGVVQRSGAAQTPAETWGALTTAFRGVDRHSFLLPPPSAFPGMAPSTPSTKAASTPEPLGRLLPGSIGLIAVPAHNGPNRPAYVDSLHEQLRSLDSTGVCGWVVDLRRNTGGNMWPMLAGIGALLAGEDVGSTTTSASGEGWHYRDGQAWPGSAVLPREIPGHGTQARGPKLRSANAPVALLMGHQTQSSGEMTAIAFMGRPNVRSFGDSTGGYASANTTIALRDGAQLIVTSAYPRDRLGRTYALTLVPDERVEAAGANAGDRQLDTAATWVMQQASCRHR
jgi:carboxyl-terminal processing protease